jgi:hypothetical protein
MDRQRKILPDQMNASLVGGIDQRLDLAEGARTVRAFEVRELD